MEKYEKVSKIQSFKDLNVWREAHKLVLLVYKVTDNFPQKEIFSLTQQIRRSAVSITSNIAEGFSRQGIKEKVQFYSMAHGSLTELENQIYLSKDIAYISEGQYNEIYFQLTIVHKLLNAFIKSTKLL